MPDRIPIAGARRNIESALRRPQSGQTYARLPRLLADHGIGLRPSTEDTAEELSRTPVQRIAPIGKTWSRTRAPYTVMMSISPEPSPHRTSTFQRIRRSNLAACAFSRPLL